MKDVINLICDVIILCILLTTGMIVIHEVFMKSLLCIAACIAIFIKIKELYLTIKKNHDKTKE